MNQKMIAMLRAWCKTDQADAITLTRNEVIQLLEEIIEEYHAGVERS